MNKSDYHQRKEERTVHYNKYVINWRLQDCGACSGSGYYCGKECGACGGTGKERYKYTPKGN